MKAFGDKRVPFYRLYSAGGIDTLRGFEYGNIGPKALYLDKNGRYSPSSDVIGGNVYAKATASLIVPTPFVSEANENYVRTSLFVDTGNVWSTTWKKDKQRLPMNYAKDIRKMLDETNKASNLRASAGVSFEWRSPIGPLVFSYAVPVKKKKYDTKESFQFTVGGFF